MKRTYKYLLLVVLSVLCFSCEEKGLDTKFIASKYKEGVVKVLIYDSELEKIKEG